MRYRAIQNYSRLNRSQRIISFIGIGIALVTGLLYLGDSAQIGLGSSTTDKKLHELSQRLDTVKGAVSKKQPTVASNTKPSVTTNISAPLGYMPFTLVVDLLPCIESWTTPGSRVDVYLSITSDFGVHGARNLISQNAVVLSFTKNKEDDYSQNIRSATVLLAVPKADAPKIEAAIKSGKISFRPRDSKMIL